MRETGYSPENFINPEQSPEAKPEILVSAAGKRTELFANVLVSYGSGRAEPLTKAQEKASNLPPIFGDLRMIKKAMAGKEAGMPLSWRETGIYAIAGSAGLYAAYLGLSGEYGEAVVTNFISNWMTRLDAGPELLNATIKNGIKAGHKIDPRLGRMLEAGWDWIAKKKERIPVFQEMLRRAYEQKTGF